MAKPTIVVAGMGRCGTSLTMQMLSAAGVPCVGTWPGFETDASSVTGFDATEFSGLSDCAIKLIDPANLAVGDMPNHVVIWLDRDPRQQAKSQAKLLGAMGFKIDRSGVRAIEGDLRRSRNKHRAAVGVPGGCDCFTVKFENLIQNSRTEAELLAMFLSGHGWRVDPVAMAAQVRQRPTTCLPGFLEDQLLSERDA